MVHLRGMQAARRYGTMELLLFYSVQPTRLWPVICAECLPLGVQAGRNCPSSCSVYGQLFYASAGTSRGMEQSSCPSPISLQSVCACVSLLGLGWSVTLGSWLNTARSPSVNSKLGPVKPHNHWETYGRAKKRLLTRGIQLCPDAKPLSYQSEDFIPTLI